MIEEDMKIKGRLRAYDEDGNKIFDKQNYILNDGMDYIVKILAGDYGGTEAWYSTTDGEEYAVESIVIGDNETKYYNIDTEITDIQGNQVNEGAVDTTDARYELVDTGHWSFVFSVTNDTTEEQSHHEAAITNNYNVPATDRLCISRIGYEEPISVEAGGTIVYVWDLILSR